VRDETESFVVVIVVGGDGDSPAAAQVKMIGHVLASAARWPMSQKPPPKRQALIKEQ
jgi:hypothetical protein